MTAPAGPRHSSCRALWKHLLIALACLMLGSCSENENTAVATDSRGESSRDLAIAADTRATEDLSPAVGDAVREITYAYLTQVERDFQTLDDQGLAFLGAVQTLLATPTESNLEAARQAWLRAHSAYQATLLHQHFAREVLSEEVTLRLNALSYQLDQWPILPGYVDAVSNYPDSGLVHDVNVIIDEANLRQVHGQFDLAEAALGFHVLEFLLWGDTANADSARPPADFDPGRNDAATLADSGLTVEQLPGNRRRALLELLSRILVSDIQASRELTVQELTGYAGELDEIAPARMLDQLIAALSSLLNEEFLVRSLYPLLNGDYSGGIESLFSRTTDIAVVARLASAERLLLETRSDGGGSLDAI